MFGPIKYEIWVKTKDGREVQAFNWTRDANSGIERAKIDAKEFAIKIIDAWAVPYKSPTIPSVNNNVS